MLEPTKYIKMFLQMFISTEYTVMPFYVHDENQSKVNQTFFVFIRFIWQNIDNNKHLSKVNSKDSMGINTNSLSLILFLRLTAIKLTWTKVMTCSEK